MNFDEFLFDSIFSLESNLRMTTRAVILLEEFIEKFANTLGELSLSLEHLCNDDLNLCFDGHRLAKLCGKLTQLQKISFFFENKLLEQSNGNLISKLTQSFTTSFWLTGHLGRVQVGVSYNSTRNMIQIFSLPYNFTEVSFNHSLDLIDVQFNTAHENSRQSPDDLWSSLQPLWSKMTEIALELHDKQHIPLTFLRVLCSPSNQYGEEDIF